MSPPLCAPRFEPDAPDPAPRPAPVRDGKTIKLGRRATDSRPAHGNFILHFLAPIVLIVALSMIALVGGTLWLTALQDRAEGVKERERVRASFVARVEAVAATTRVFGVWDDAARKLVAGFDPAWTDINIGAYVFDQEGFEATFVTDEGGRPIYGYVDSRRSALDPAQLLGRGYSHAIRRSSRRALWPASRSAGSA